MSNQIENILEEYNFYDDLEVKVISRENINDSISKCIPEAWSNALCEDNTSPLEPQNAPKSGVSR